MASQSGGSGTFGSGISLVAGACSWRASKIESRRNWAPPQPGQAGRESVSRSESWLPQTMQKYVPEPGIVPVSEVSPRGLEPTLSKI